MDYEKLETIMNYYGKTGQTIKAIEELAELQTELAKQLNGQGSREALLSELADVSIMFVQICIFYGIGPDELDDKANHKLDRQIRRIEEAEQCVTK